MSWNICIVYIHRTVSMQSDLGVKSEGERPSDPVYKHEVKLSTIDQK